MWWRFWVVLQVMVDDDSGLWVVLLGGSGLFHWVAMGCGLWVVMGGGSGLWWPVEQAGRMREEVERMRKERDRG